MLMYLRLLFLLDRWATKGLEHVGPRKKYRMDFGKIRAVFN